MIIIEEAEGWGADLIVVGSHGYHDGKKCCWDRSRRQSQRRLDAPWTLSVPAGVTSSHRRYSCRHTSRKDAKTQRGLNHSPFFFACPLRLCVFARVCRATTVLHRALVSRRTIQSRYRNVVQPQIDTKLCPVMNNVIHHPRPQHGSVWHGKQLFTRHEESPGLHAGPRLLHL